MDWCRRVKAGEQWTFTFYSEVIFGVYVHWYSGRTIPCYDPPSQCAGHKAGAPVKWLGYLHGHNHELARDEFLEIPNGAALRFFQQLGVDFLRGTRARFSKGRGDKAKLAIEFLARHEKISQSTPLPKAETPEKRLRKLWGLNESKLKLHLEDGLPGEQVG